MTKQQTIDTSQSPPLITVIVVNYNCGEMICQCIASLERQRFRDFVTVVVDNNSSDGSVSAIRKEHPTVELIVLEANMGFAGGVNHALRECKLGRLVVLLNPDAFPTPEWLENLAVGAQAHPEYAAFGSRMFSDKGMKQLDGVGDVYHVSGLPWRQGHGCTNSDRHNREMEIFAPCAAAAMYRVDALQAIGYFDEDFFLYIEDVDLGFRLRLAGYRSLYIPNANVLHIGSAFVGKHSDFQIYHGHRNLVWVYIKNMPGVLFWAFLPLHILLNIASLVWLILRGQGAAAMRAKRDAIEGIPLFWKKRAVIQAGRKASVWSIFQQLSWNPFSRCG
jgi:GT2 family glycosyltransferase